MLESTGVTATSTAVQYSFRSHPTFSAPFTGLILVKFAQAVPTGSGTLPVQFVSEGNEAKPLKGFGNANVTAGTIPGTGVALVFYDRRSDTLQLVTILG